MDPAVATEAILQRMSKTKNNAEFLEALTEAA
jgi:transcription termination factor Rho